eukprot:7286765-Pyramimonas_sp.AAC.1
MCIRDSSTLGYVDAAVFGICDGIGELCACFAAIPVNLGSLPCSVGAASLSAIVGVPRLISR